MLYPLGSTFALCRMALQKIKRIAQHQEHGFESGKDHEKAVVYLEKQSVIEAPFSGRGTRLHGAIETARRHDKEVQQQAIKADPEHDPEKRANAGEERAQAIVCAAECHK